MRIFAQSPMIVKATRSGSDIITAITAGAYDDTGAGPASCTLTINSSGSWGVVGGWLGSLGSGSWINNTANAGNYSVRWTNTAGTLSSGGPAGSWLALTSSQTFAVSRGGVAGTKSCTGTVDFALTSNTSVILATSSVTISATNETGGSQAV